jgi:hypothetical protein
MDRQRMRIAIQGALYLIQSKKTWTQVQRACDAQGEMCDAESRQARRWCAEGAIERSLHELGFDHTCDDLVAEIGIALTGSSMHLVYINDELGYRQVKRVLREGLMKLGGPLNGRMPRHVERAFGRLRAAGQGGQQSNAPGKGSRARRAGGGLPAKPMSNPAAGQRHRADNAGVELSFGRSRAPRELESV